MYQVVETEEEQEVEDRLQDYELHGERVVHERLHEDVDVPLREVLFSSIRAPKEQIASCFLRLVLRSYSSTRTRLR